MAPLWPSKLLRQVPAFCFFHVKCRHSSSSSTGIGGETLLGIAFGFRRNQISFFGPVSRRSGSAQSVGGASGAVPKVSPTFR